MSSVTESEVKTATQSDEQLADKLTKEYVRAVGKSVTNVLALADVVKRAKNGLSPDAHKAWLLQNRTDEAKASKYRSIAECSEFKKADIQEQLPPSFTMMYQLSRIMRHDEFTLEVARGHFATTLAMLNTPSADGRFPTVAEITSHVNGLLGKRLVPMPKTETTVGPADHHGPVLLNPETEVCGTQSDGLTNGALRLIDETTPEDFEDDNDIQIRLEFDEAYRKAGVRRAIARILHENGIKSVEVIVRAKCAPGAMAA